MVTWTVNNLSRKGNLLIIFSIAISSYVYLANFSTSSNIFVSIPYFLLLTPYRQETLAFWLKYAKPNDAITYPPSHIPEIYYQNYSYESLRQATSNFRYPAVVRGMFSDTNAIKMWKTLDYLPSVLNEFSIPIVRNARVGTLQDDRVVVPFTSAFHDMHKSNHSTEYLFFPVKSRFSFNGSDAGSAASLQSSVDDLCRKDLDLDRIWSGFGSKRHSTFMGSQFVIGKSTSEWGKNTTGSDWHCAIGNNWFIQAAGRKHWEFVKPEYSPFMAPLKGGMFNMWTGNANMSHAQRHVPTMFVDLEEGDMLYNPDWMWHKVTNYGGLSIGIPLREKNLTLSVQNNAYFSVIVSLNVALSRWGRGLSLGGFPPPSAATEQDN